MWWSAPYDVCQLGVESLLLHIERSQRRWLWYVNRMSPGLYVAQLALERLGILAEELGEASGQSEVWVFLLRPLPLQPVP